LEVSISELIASKAKGDAGGPDRIVPMPYLCSDFIIFFRFYVLQKVNVTVESLQQ